MKRLIAVLLLTLATAAFAQEKKEDDYNTVREFKNKIIVVHNREPRDIMASIRLLGSGFKGSGISYNHETNTITVRDFPENVAAIEDAVTRLDKPLPAVPDIEMKIAVLVGSKTPLGTATLPDDLAPVVKQLQSTLRYSHYGLLTGVIQRTKSGSNGVEGSGVAESSLLGGIAQEGQPVLYAYTLRDISADGGIDIGNFRFSLKFPLKTGNSYSYQNVGFETPVSIRPNEKVVIGTTTMGDKAIIVVLNASVGSSDRAAAQK